MTKRRQPIDDLIDALVWMRRKAKKAKKMRSSNSPSLAQIAHRQSG